MFGRAVREGLKSGGSCGKHLLGSFPLVTGTTLATRISVFIFSVSFECFVLKRDHADINVLIMFFMTIWHSACPSWGKRARLSFFIIIRWPVQLPAP